ncbi:MAG: hypothetical protein HOV87_13685 [Catenulispora sp.]|nr:hypothetical protein [Catenulispora sp.]
MAAVIKLPGQRSGGVGAAKTGAGTGSKAEVETAASAEAASEAVEAPEAPEAPDTTEAVEAVEAPEVPAAPTTPEISTPRKHLRAVAATLTVYLGLHTVAFLSLLWVLHLRAEPLTKFLHQGWDSAFYLGIARDGYHHSTDYAFFPLYPLLVRVVHVLPWLSYNYAGVLTSILTGSAAAVGIRYVGEKVSSARTGLVAVALWAVVPTAIIQVWPYADGLFVAFAAWALYAVLRRAWIAAGVLTFFGGLTRPSAFALILAVGLFALVSILRREDGWRPWVCAAVAPLGMLGYIAFVGHHFGKPTAYFRMQHDAWDNWFDAGKTTVDILAALVDGRAENPNVMYLLAVLTMLAVPFLFVLACRQRLPWPVLVFCAALSTLVLCSHRQIFITPRELMPAFPLLLPLAQVLSRARNRGLIVAMVVIAAASGWYAWFIPLTYGAP